MDTAQPYLLSLTIRAKELHLIQYLGSIYYLYCLSILARSIYGFVYERGYEYPLKVRKDGITPHVNQSLVNYTLIKVISKEEKIVLYFLILV